MNCHEVENCLEAFLDTELPATESAAVRLHLPTCTSCRNNLKELEAIRLMLRDNLATEAPTSLDRNVMRAFDRYYSGSAGVTKTRSRGSLFAISLPAFALGLLLVIAASLLAFYVGKRSAMAEVAATQRFDQASTKNEIEKEITSAKIDENDEREGRLPSRTASAGIDPRSENLRKPPMNLREGSVTHERVKPTSPARIAAQNTPVTSRLDLEGFTPVAEPKLKITRKENQKNAK
jgi:hypothetical protein